MKRITIAFDCDGTLIDNTTKPGVIKANEEIRTLLITLAKFKNVKIIVWS
jgi:FMN phosphatase YigB (HAD superfamily)